MVKKLVHTTICEKFLEHFSFSSLSSFQLCSLHTTILYKTELEALSVHQVHIQYRCHRFSCRQRLDHVIHGVASMTLIFTTMVDILDEFQTDFKRSYICTHRQAQHCQALCGDFLPDGDRPVFRRKSLADGVQHRLPPPLLGCSSFLLATKCSMATPA
jgi:hypothetical protein